MKYKAFVLFTMIIAVSVETHAKRKENCKHSDNKDKNGFSWIFPKRSPVDNYKKLFDVKAILGFDTESIEAMTKIEQMKFEFKNADRILKKELDLNIYKMMDLIEQQKTGIDHSEEIFTLYKEIFRLTSSNYTLLSIHSKKMADVFHETYTNLEIKINSKLKETETNKIKLANEIIERYDIYQSEAPHKEKFKKEKHK
ncbi:MAG: hypothetical protein ACRCTQ_04530 [Brevinemataceae bacterium]